MKNENKTKANLFVKNLIDHCDYELEDEELEEIHTMNEQQLDTLLIEQGYNINDVNSKFENLRKRLEVPQKLSSIKNTKPEDNFITILKTKVSELLQPQPELTYSWAMRGNQDENQLPLKLNHFRKLADKQWQIRFDFTSLIKDAEFQMLINDQAIELEHVRSPNGKWCIIKFLSDDDFSGDEEINLSIPEDKTNKIFRISITR